MAFDSKLHTYSDLLAFPYDGGQHRTGTQKGPGEVVLRNQQKERTRFIDVDHGDGYKHKGTDKKIIRQKPFSEEFMWNSESLKANTRLIYDTARKHPSTDCFCLFGDHSMDGGFFHGNNERLGKMGFTHHLVMMDAHGDSHHPSSSPSGNCHGMMMGSIIMGVDLLYGSNPVHSLGSAGVNDDLIKQVRLGKPFSYNGEVWLPNATPLPAKRLFMFGTHSLEPAEKMIIHEYASKGAHVWSPEDVEHMGVPKILKTIQDNLLGDFPSIHISLDVDVTHGLVCTGTPEGLVDYDKVCEMLIGLDDTKKVRSGGMFEMNPLLRPEYLEKERDVWAHYSTLFMRTKNSSML